MPIFHVLICQTKVTGQVSSCIPRNLLAVIYELDVYMSIVMCCIFYFLFVWFCALRIECNSLQQMYHLSFSSLFCCLCGYMERELHDEVYLLSSNVLTVLGLWHFSIISLPEYLHLFDKVDVGWATSQILSFYLWTLAVRN